MKRSQRFLLAVWCIAVPTKVTGGEVPLSEALAIIEAHQKRIVVAEWTAEGVDGSYDDPARLDSLQVPNPEFSPKTKVLIDFRGMRYRIESSHVNPWVDGTDPFLSKIQRYSFDGKTSRSYDRSLPGTKLPGTKEGVQEGTVGYPNTREVFDRVAFGCGLSFCPPFFYGRPFSEFLQASTRGNQSIRILEMPDGLWQIDTTPPELSLSPEFTLFRIKYDPRKGIILGATWVDKPKADPSSGRTWRRLEFEWQTTAEGVWVPNTVHLVNVPDRAGSRIRYHDMRVNQPVDDSAFQLVFPIGTQVVDEVERKRYTVSRGVVDEQEAIRAFMRYHGLADDDIASVTPDIGRRNRLLAWTFLGLNACVLAGLLMIRRRRGRGNIVAAPVLAALLLGNQAALGSDSDRDGNWSVNHGGTPIRISQCGFNVTVLALECFNKSYDVAQVSLALPPTSEGISLAEIKNVLEGHGLEVNAREKVTLTALAEVLQPGVIALFPFKIDESTNHYVIAMKHSRHGLIVADPPDAVAAFGTLSEQRFAAAGGVALFLSRPKAPVAVQAEKVRCMPDNIDLGRFRSDDGGLSKPGRHKVRLTNVAKTAVVVSGVRSHCGCVRCEWSGGLLRPNQGVDLEITVIPNAFGEGRVERRIGFEFADSSSLAVTFVLETIPVVKEQPLLVLGDDVVRTEIRSEDVLERQVSVQMGNASEKEVTITSNQVWLRADLRKAETEGYVLAMRIDPRTIPRSLDRAEGTVSVVGKPASVPVNIRVIATRFEPFRVVPDTVVMGTGQNAKAVIRLVTMEKGLELGTPVELLQCPDGLVVEQVKADSAAVRLQLTASKPLVKGLYVVRVQFGAMNGCPARVRFVLSVEDVMTQTN